MCPESSTLIVNGPILYDLMCSAIDQRLLIEYELLLYLNSSFTKGNRYKCLTSYVEATS